MQIRPESSAPLPARTPPTAYHGLHWGSVNRVEDYLYRQFAPVLDDALARLEAAERIETGRTRSTLAPVAHRLEMARNTLAAWAALITVESGGLVPSGKRLPVAVPMLPEWLTEHIRSRTTLTLDYKRPIFVHPEVLFESLLLLSQVGEEIGALLQITLADAVETPRGVWLRTVFVPPARGAYSGMSTLLNALNARGDAGDAAFCLQVTSSLMKINGARLTLQNNRKTGEQALAALLPTLTADDLREAHSEARRAPLRFAEHGQTSSPPGSTGPLTPFRLDDDTETLSAEGPVPVFPPGALETWLDSDADALEASDSVAPPQPPES